MGIGEAVLMAFELLPWDISVSTQHPTILQREEDGRERWGERWRDRRSDTGVM